jgi:hypothetical protein
MANEFIIKNGYISKGDGVINGGLNISTIGGGTPLINLGLDSNGNVVTGVTTVDTNTFTTGATLNGTVLEFDRNDLSNAYNVDLNPLIFTGNTSGDCITDLYVTNLYGCSPITVNDSIQSVTSSATGTTSFAFGSGATASGDYSHAEGIGTTASGNASHAEGFQTTASGLYAHAEGEFSIASGQSSHSEGGYTTSIGAFSHSEGYFTTAINIFSHAEGIETIANGLASHAEGGQTTASGDYSHAEGGNTIASGDYSHAEGFLTTSFGNQSHAGGYNSIASGLTSFIHSTNSLVTGDRSVVLGGQNITGTTNDTVYVPNLNISTLGTGTSVNNLGIDSNGNVVAGDVGTVNTNYNPTGGTITTSDNYVRYNLTGDTVVKLPSTAGSTPTPKEGQVLNIIKIGPNKLRLETSVPHAIQGAPDGSSPTPLTSGNSLDLLSANTVSVTLIYDGGLDSWVVMSCSDYNEINYNETL